MAVLEGWAQSTEIGSLTADHTYVYCPENGKYFDCWGSHGRSDARRICSGNGNYTIADCYRCPVVTPVGIFPDTAGIGVYGVDGVCHQSANCFLYSCSPRVTLNDKVRGYEITSSPYLYGIFGKQYGTWLTDVYNPCAKQISKDMQTESARDGSPESDLIERIGRIHTAGRQSGRDANQVLADETSELLSFLAPDVDRDQFRETQLKYLRELDELTATGMKGEALADRINSLAHRMQRELSEQLTPGQYERLLGTSPGTLVDVIEPGLRSATGQPVEPLEE